MKLLNHIPPSATAMFSGTILPHIAGTTAAYRQALNEHYGKSHIAVQDSIAKIKQRRLEVRG